MTPYKCRILSRGRAKSFLSLGLKSAVILGVAWLGIAPRASAQWPQWGGPNADFKVETPALADSWPDGGPKKLWSAEIGDSYSSIVTDEKTLYTMGKDGNKETFLALDAASGKTKWVYKFDETQYEGLSKQFGTGPNSTPLVHKGKVYGAGMGAQLFCLDKDSGKVIWSHDLMKEMNATGPIWGYASSPIAYKDTLIVLSGGEGNSVVAFDLNSGNVVWKKHNYKNGYATPMILELDGEEQLVAFMAEEIVGMDPTNGELKWSFPHKTDYDINAMRPIFGEDNLLFFSSGYNNGSQVVKLSRSGKSTDVEEVWASRKLKIQFGNAIRVDDHMYFSAGMTGRANFFTAVDINTGSMEWRERGYPRGSLLYADGKFLILDEDGKLTLAKASPDGFERLDQAQVLEKVAWSPPTLVGTTMFLRDRKSVMALDLGSSRS